ncbi:retrovirus-related Pol polyprotein from transposon 17.6 [Trichonephila inaurata madagascariensis]|uniref:Retrovirus-related Pol polyprotein from transposon 17.6 n=1 Tax=Trichonephila inaurata madagascariensis TaxID=2747483 RepID=A0A8X7BZ85_9ARAC|nr:retrovirus-related Pol polyprotein from transposon 17.6 [Trichonephila inaurata madagascariensis]
MAVRETGVISPGALPATFNSSQRTDVTTNHINAYTTQTRSPRLTLAKGNRTLLGTDFLSSAGLVLDVKNTCWHFWDNPAHKYPFGKELDTPSIAEKMSSNTCQLREGEGESLTSAQKEKLTLLLESFQNVFEPGEAAIS